jgi:EpsD family peptidyl-prolyl cis-trans isomerase
MNFSTYGRSLVLMAIGSILAACEETTTNTSTGSVAATVNGAVITTAELDAALPHGPDGSPDADKTTSAAVLQKLVQQQLLVQKAREGKVDRDPEVMMAMENARRAVLANEWLQHVVAGIPPPSDQDIRGYYAQHPELFSDRRVYTIRMAVVRTSANELPKIEQQLAKAKPLEQVLNYLRANNMHFVIDQVNVGSDELPADLLRRFNQLTDGDEIAFASDDGVRVAQLISERPDPVNEAQARPVIENLVRAQIEKGRVEAAIAPLRANAKIEVIGDFRPESSPSKAGPEADRITEGIGTGIK